jgi:hypothetical protein
VGAPTYETLVRAVTVLKKRVAELESEAREGETKMTPLARHIALALTAAKHCRVVRPGLEATSKPDRSKRNCKAPLQSPADLLSPAQAAARRTRTRKPTLVSVARQASKAGLDVARYEVKPDGTVVVVTGKGEQSTINEWDEVLPHGKH